MDLFPGCPGILDGSCWRTAQLWSLMSEPVVSDEGFAAGPLLLPGLPGIPAPEFCPLGTVTRFARNVATDLNLI